MNNVSPSINVSAPVLTHTISGSVSGAGGFTKAGPGALTLSGANSFTGNVGVNAGLLTLGNANALPIASAVGVSVAAARNSTSTRKPRPSGRSPAPAS